jgi:hypothetical protein
VAADSPEGKQERSDDASFRGSENGWLTASKGLTTPIFLPRPNFPGDPQMAHSSNDDLVREMREHRVKQIQDCSDRAAHKIASRLTKAKLSVDELTVIISNEFKEMTG